jgi:ABC-type phosphate/phosphonate transport system substrate-binding protein
LAAQPNSPHGAGSAGLSASLPMYNLAEMAEAHADLWKAIVSECGPTADLPARLAFDRPPVPKAIGPEVIFSQICGYPLQTIFRGQYRLLGTPSYRAPGCGPGTHRAFVVVRDGSRFRRLEDLRGATFALNSRHSNSGMNLPRRLIAPLAGGRSFFRSVVETGAHPASIERVSSGELDAASIDCLTYAFFKDHRPKAVAPLRIIAETPESPAIPFITSALTSTAQAEALGEALVRLSSDPARRSILDALRIQSIGPANPASYHRLLDYEREAAQLGYPTLT